MSVYVLSIFNDFVFSFFINLTLSIDLKNTVLIGLLIDILYIHTTLDEGSLLLFKISLKRLGTTGIDYSELRRVQPLWSTNQLRSF